MRDAVMPTTTPDDKKRFGEEEEEEGEEERIMHHDHQHQYQHHARHPSEIASVSAHSDTIKDETTFLSNQDEKIGHLERAIAFTEEDFVRPKFAHPTRTRGEQQQQQQHGHNNNHHRHPIGKSTTTFLQRNFSSSTKEDEGMQDEYGDMDDSGETFTTTNFK